MAWMELVALVPALQPLRHESREQFILHTTKAIENITRPEKQQKSTSRSCLSHTQSDIKRNVREELIQRFKL